jgi:CHAT domain-containing protein
MIEGLSSGEVVFASCHGQFVGADFLRSRLLLGGGQSLTLADALGPGVDLRGLRLLVLSACQTAVLDLRGATGEVRSLAAGMLAAGARAVIASLWSVDDRATYLLMVRFAQEWLPGMSERRPESALAAAQAWLRTATNGDLALWSDGLAAPALADGDPAEPDRGTVTIRGRGERYAAAEAAQLAGGLFARRAAAAPNDVPYADPIFWAGFQLYGR